MLTSQELTHAPTPRGHRPEWHRFAAAALAATATTALAGPCWEEPPITQAGSTPQTAQITKGTGPLTCINGRVGLGPTLGPADLEDMYLININDPAAFSASTSPEFGAAADFPTALWLFPANANAALANREFAAGIPGSLLLPEANDDTGFTLTEPGLYYIAVTAANSMPVSGPDLLPMFSFDFPFEISGPDGPGANQPVKAWDNAPADGNYTIKLTGTTFAAPPCLGDLNNDGIVDADDLGILLGNFGCAGNLCIADINNDAIVDADDLGILLGSFGQICGPFGPCCLPDGTCQTLSIYQCQQLGGLFQGEARHCDTITCQPPPNTSTCCTPQPKPGCDNDQCQAAVCANDPFCCETQWDAICANQAIENPACPCN